MTKRRWIKSNPSDRIFAWDKDCLDDTFERMAKNEGLVLAFTIPPPGEVKKLIKELYLEAIKKACI
jgi:hypothetical protein